MRRGLELLRIHVFENDGDFGWEWPQNNEGWKWKEVQAFLRDVHLKKQNLYRTLLHGCQVGVVNQDGIPVKKPWTIYVTDRQFAAALHLVCQGNHQHAECLGGTTAKMSGFYPLRMVRIIARQILRPSSPPSASSYMVDDENSPEYDMVMTNEKLEGGEDVTPEGVTPTEWKRVRELVYRLHVRAGHPSVRGLVNSLKSRGAHPVIILAAKHLQCDDCAETKPGPASSKASFNRADVIWHTLQVDNAQFKICSVQDRLSHLQCDAYGRRSQHFHRSTSFECH